MKKQEYRILQLCNLPEDQMFFFKNSTSIHLFKPSDPDNFSSTKSELSDLIKSLTSVECVLGQVNTPIAWWMQAAHTLSDAQYLCFDPTKTEWLNLNTLEAESLSDVDTDRVSEIQESVEVEQPVVTEKVKTNNQPYANLSFGALLNEILKIASWTSSKDVDRQLNELLIEVQRREASNRGMTKKAKDNILLGQQANALEKEIKKKVNQAIGSKNAAAIDEIKVWLQSQPNMELPHYKRLVEFRFRQAKKFGLNTIAKNEIKPKNSSVKLTMHDNHHPNNLRFLPPTSRWTFVVDETGETFNYDDAQQLGYADKKLGRVVCLAIPDYVENALPKLNRHHATEASHQQNDEVIQNTINAQVGVFGFTVNDKGLDVKSRWFDAIYQLTRWVVLMTPFDPNSPTELNFEIEQRGVYTSNYSIQVIAERIESELIAVDPERYKNCKLSMRFIGKDGSPYNGYVDTIAHMWGSKDGLAKERLRRSGLEAHCLMRPDSESIEQFYLNVNQHELKPDQWYKMLSSIIDEPRNSLLNTIMDRLKVSLKDNPSLWLSYLDLILERLRAKQYSTKTLGLYLDWLEAARPAEQQLPPMAKLQWLAFQLAQSNHSGRMNVGLIDQAFLLSNQLFDESAPDAMEVSLRIAVAATNAFEYSSVKPLVEKWLTYPVATVGLANYAKLQSTLGQLNAFELNADKSIQCFEGALDSIDKLSDRTQSHRERKQTYTYLLMAQMDANQDGWVANIKAHLFNFETDIKKAMRKLAFNQASNPVELQYLHHLMLRAFVRSPHEFEEYILSYLSHSQVWCSQSEHHPWQWIYAYRGVLLAQNNDTSGAVTEFRNALDLTLDTEQVGVTVQWIGYVILHLADHLGLNLQPEYQARFDQLQLEQTLPRAPHDALTSWRLSNEFEIWDGLMQCTPFNFH
ncbi:hypothetical protein [Thiomicrospira microaerophila]|uniref:hypothetical protein n=1 Tax=Thiomicrospira microaerophila TaxID=406020 RepID=UPI0005C997E1|nr:hypothetical protein [Thiomicrospira microaerophila]